MRDDAEYSSSIHDSILALEVKHEVTIGGKLLRRFAEGELADWLGRVAQAAVRVSRDGSDERVDSSAGSVVVSPGKSGRAMPLTGPPIVGRGWPRTATLLQDKCEQISRSGAGWLRFDLLDGQWQFTPWATLPLPAKTETLAAQLRSSISGASGAVLSHGAGFAQGQFLAENYRSPAGAIGLRRLIAPCRVRETIIVPLTNDVDAQTQTWIDIYDDEPSSFVRCRFAGDLKDVIFWDHGFRTGKAAPNRMEDVDFGDAPLRFVEFRRLDLDRVTFPSSPEHLVVRAYRRTLDCALGAVERVDNPPGRRARALVEHRRKWSGPHQETGVFYLSDLGENEADAAWLADILRRCESACLGE